MDKSKVAHFFGPRCRFCLCIQEKLWIWPSSYCICCLALDFFFFCLRLMALLRLISVDSDLAVGSVTAWLDEAMWTLSSSLSLAAAAPPVELPPSPVSADVEARAVTAAAMSCISSCISLSIRVHELTPPSPITATPVQNN